MKNDKTLYINEVNAHFYIKHPPEDMSVEGLNALVDTYMQSEHLQGILFNVNVQRALFDSRVWEPIYHGYDPELGPDQECLQWLEPEKRQLRLNCHGRNWIHNLWLLKDRKIDHFAVWLERCKHHGCEGWLSIRMNDCHHNDDEEAFWHPAIWKEHPEYRRATYRNEGWFEGAFDYGIPEVVEHHMKLIEETCSRWDMFGIELDWVRWVRHFRPGSEEKNAYILTEVMRRTRALTEQAAERLGHPVKLAVRLPADLTACQTMGYDVVVWAEEKLCDMITLAPFFTQPFYDFQIKLWRGIFGENVKILCQPELEAHASPVSAGIVRDYRIHFGVCASALQRGADAVYHFNDCYREGPVDKIRDRYPTIIDELLNVTPDLEKLRNFTRRHMVSYAQVVGPGMPTGSVFPIALTKPLYCHDFSRHGKAITLRIPLGPKPSTAKTVLILGFDAATPNLEGTEFPIWINGQALTWKPCEINVEIPDPVTQVITLELPNELLQDDTNIIEFLPPEVPGNIFWAEFAVGY